MKRYVTAAPHGEPPVTPSVAASAAPTETAHCTSRPDLRSARRLPHRTPTPRLAAAGPDREPEPRSASDPGCRRFTEFALRSVLEVLDRRRNPSGLHGLLAPTPLDLVAALTRAGTPGRTHGAAALRKVHIRHIGPDVAEVFGTYARGPRTFAIAGRVERSTHRAPSGAGSRTASSPKPTQPGPGVPGPGWVVTSLQVG